MRNAFNAIRRDKILSVVRRRVPELYRFSWQAYASDSFLFFGDTTIMSATGVQQGDPLGPALFSLAIDEAVRSVSTDLNIWYLDDGTVGGAVEDVVSSLVGIIPAFADMGLEINDAKCEVFLLNCSRQQEGEYLAKIRRVLPAVRFPEAACRHLLGSPLTSEAIVPSLRAKLETLSSMRDRLQCLDAHQAFTLLKNCLAVPKLQYLLRTCDAYNHAADLGMLDDVIRDAVQMILNVHTSDQQWSQATMPVRLGGIGIRRLVDIAAPAYISSLHFTAELVSSILSNLPELEGTAKLEAAVQHWKGYVGTEETPDEEEASKQKAWDSIGSQLQQSSLLDNADQITRARLLAAASKESGVWLHAVPVPSMGTHLDSETLRIGIALRLGAAVCQPHECRCSRTADILGHHALSCRFSAGRLPRHSALNDVVKRALHRAGLPSVLEPVGLCRDDGGRPDGATVFPFHRGFCLLWDVTCVDTFARCHVLECAVNTGSAAAKAEERKRTKYRNLADRYQFEPLAFETTGVFGPSTHRVIQEIGRRMAAETGDQRETFWFKQRLAIAIVRGNACSIRSGARADQQGLN
jgi:hypothetical protein